MMTITGNQPMRAHGVSVHVFSGLLVGEAVTS